MQVNMHGKTQYPPNVLVCGAGSIGIRHITNLVDLNVNVFVWRNRKAKLTELEALYNVTAFADIDTAIKAADAVVIATETSTHLDIAFKAANQGKALYIEKPLSNSIDRLNDFSKLAEDKNLTVEVGYQLRSHPNLVFLKDFLASSDLGPLYTYRFVVGQRLDAWRPGTDYRHSYSASKQKGGGVLLDLVHEIDLINWLTGPIDSVLARMDKVSDLEIETEDLVNVIFTNKSSSVGQLQMDYLTPGYRRSMELVFRDALIVWNYQEGVLQLHDTTSNRILHQVAPDFNRNSMFIELMKHFLNNLNKAAPEPLCSLEDAIDTQVIVHAINKAAIDGRSQKINRIDQ